MIRDIDLHQGFVVWRWFFFTLLMLLYSLTLYEFSTRRLVDCTIIYTLPSITGADTTTTSLLWTLLYLTAWPEKQKKLHEEIDKVIGEREPQASDKANMHYLRATIYEALRLSSLTPLGVPRKATETTRVGGFDIPKGTTVIFNLYAMNHDSLVWQKPHDFNPERFLNEEGLFYPSRVNFMPFSAGKRVCLGESVAKLELFLVLAYLLKNFKFCADDSLDLEGVNGATLKPKPFKVRVVNRNATK